MKKYEEVQFVLKGNIDHLISLEGVHAVGIGYSTEKEHTDELSIHVYIESEKAANNLLQSGKIFKEIGSIPVSVIIMPPISCDILYVDKDTILPDDKQYRPLRGGTQLYLEDHKQAWLGTLGIFVKSQNALDDNLYILSNLHVLDALDRAVYQPDKRAKDSFVATTSIARSFPDTDAALAKINDRKNIEINCIQDIGVVDGIQSVTINDLHKKVIKRGRTTLLTEGTIDAISASVIVNMGEGVIRTFTDCVIVKPNEGGQFSAPGDSGSCVVLKENKKLIGLHFAGSTQRSIFCKINNVFTNFDVDLPENNH